jgi:putative transposase
MSTTPRKKHSKAEIVANLVRAGDLAQRGMLQREIAHTLGVSVMTLHRWRKESSDPHETSLVPDRGPQLEQERGSRRRCAELETENSRLRRLLTDLLLEKAKAQEVGGGNTLSFQRRSRRSG